MKLAAATARLAVLVVAAAARLRKGDVVTTSQANVATNPTGGQFPGQSATVLNTNAPGMCAIAPCMEAGCCCWSTLYQEEHPDYPNPEVKNRERKCIRGGLPEQYVLVKEPGYVGTDGQYEAQMANQNPDFGVGRDLCCVTSKDDVITQASRHSMEEEVPVIETTLPPLLVNPDPTTTTTTTTTTPPPPPPPPLHNMTNGTNGTNGTNHTNDTNTTVRALASEYVHRESADEETDPSESEFERMEKKANGGFDFRDLARLQADASAVMTSRGHGWALRGGNAANAH